jgi:serine/threonine protein kinase
VRELAHASVANLFGVERDGDDAFLMWEYVEGLRLDFYTGANHTPREVASVLRETVLAVDLLHMQGIVHGALIGSNVVVTFGGAVRLTHISPLVYTDPKVDIECVWNLLDHAAEQLGERGSMLLALAGEARRRNLPLRQLATRLGPLIDSRDAKKAVETEQLPESSPRRRTLISAALVAALGLAMAWGAWWAIGSGRFSFSDGFHHPFHTQADR